MSHIICSMALVALIFVIPSFYLIVVDNVENQVIVRELQEISDYTSNTIENLYFLVNSTSGQDVTLEKDLMYLPSSVEDSIYVLNIITESNGEVEEVINVQAYLKTNPSLIANSWILPGLTLADENVSLESGERLAIVGCRRNETGNYVWIRYD
jgi:archaellin